MPKLDILTVPKNLISAAPAHPLEAEYSPYFFLSPSVPSLQR